MSSTSKRWYTSGVTGDPALAAACAFWQFGQDGSSLLRGGARVLTGIPHYFDAHFITKYENLAREDPRALGYARLLLDHLAVSRTREISDWAEMVSYAGPSFAGRGLKPNPGKDEQIEQRLAEGEIVMPLWGISLDREVTNRYGSRFLLEIRGSFPAIPVSLYSSIKADELELVTGGRYEVVESHRESGSTHAILRWIEPCQAEPSADPEL